MKQAMTVYCPKCGQAMMPTGSGDRRRFECARGHDAEPLMMAKLITGESEVVPTIDVKLI